MQTFLQQDLIDGRVEYLHNGNEIGKKPLYDLATVMVSDRRGKRHNSRDSNCFITAANVVNLLVLLLLKFIGALLLNTVNYFATIISTGLSLFRQVRKNSAKDQSY